MCMLGGVWIRRIECYPSNNLNKKLIGKSRAARCHIKSQFFPEEGTMQLIPRGLRNNFTTSDRNKHGKYVTITLASACFKSNACISCHCHKWKSLFWQLIFLAAKSNTPTVSILFDFKDLTEGPHGCYVSFAIKYLRVHMSEPVSKRISHPRYTSFVNISRIL